MMHRLIEAAAAGELPSWAEVSPKRAEHIARVAALLDEWAHAAGLAETDRQRWRAAGTLHDALHDASPKELRQTVPEIFRDLPGGMLHGPACVVRLRADGVTDEALLHAIDYHTIGHPSLGMIGSALYAADYLEPGRSHDQAVRSALRSRMPDDIDVVVPAILRDRLLDQVRRGRKIRPETVAFWNSIPNDRRE
jgi:2-amino-4-hydroxy-6-hydroxymethyldihydropteridine diphosphokinase